jgi:outer membrane immunogenic protein
MRMRIGGWALVTALAALPFGNVAQATDMPVKALPPVAPAGNWTGFYVGGHIGYGWADKDFSLPDIAGQKFGDCSGKHQDCFDFSKLGSPALSHRLAGLLGGVQAGFNLQSGAFVYGVEGDLSWTGMKEDSLSKLGTFRHLDCWYDVYKEIDLKAHTEVNWIATLSGRVGYAIDRVLIYAKGGVAFADQDYNWIVTKGSHELATAKFSDTRTGWIVGGGAEWALGHNWSAKLEYNYMDFGTETLNVGASVCLNGQCSKKDVRVDIEEHMHVVKLGINYRFGMPGFVRANY